jgi:hypothetical protein
MRKTSIALVVLLLLAPQFGAAQSSHSVTVSGCVLSANGSFRLLTKTHTYILKGHNDELFGYNGKLVQITGTEDAPQSKAQDVPVVLHISKIKKIADFCQ